MQSLCKPVSNGGMEVRERSQIAVSPMTVFSVAACRAGVVPALGIRFCSRGSVLSLDCQPMLGAINALATAPPICGVDAYLIRFVLVFG